MAPTALAALFAAALQTRNGANLGGGAESQCSCAQLPKGHEGQLEAPTPSPAWSLLARITALQRSSCCPPAGPLASGPGCQPAREEAAWLAASSWCLSCQPGGRPGRAETPTPKQGSSQAVGQGQVSPHHPSHKGALLMPAPSRAQGCNRAAEGPRRPRRHGGPIVIHSAQLFTNEKATRGAGGDF